MKPGNPEKREVRNLGISINTGTAICLDHYSQINKMPGGIMTRPLGECDKTCFRSRSGT